MRRGTLPKTLHVDEPSSQVDWEAGEIELLTEQVPWEADGRPAPGRRLLLRHQRHQRPRDPGGGAESEPVERGVRQPNLLARSRSSSRPKQSPPWPKRQSASPAHIEESPELDPTDVAYSLATTRSAFEHRAVVIGSDREELLAALAALADRPSGAPSQAAFAGVPARGLPMVGRARDGKLAFLFTGQGSQRLGMGKELYESDPVFREAFDAVCEQLDPHLDTPLQEIVFAKGKKAQALLDDTTYAQPALFAIEVALFEALAREGSKPDLARRPLDRRDRRRPCRRSLSTLPTRPSSSPPGAA